MDARRIAPNLVLWLFPLVVLGLIVGLVIAIVTVSSNFLGGRGVSTLLQWLVIPLVIAVGFGAWTAFRYKAQPASGLEVLPQEHPQIWAEVNELAALASTEPPQRIVITAEVNASVTEVAGHRELIIGLPLLATFTRGELR